MNFLSSFESKQDGVNDTVEFVVRVAIITLSAVILVVVLALVVGLFVSNDVVDSAAILEIVNPALQEHSQNLQKELNYATSYYQIASYLFQNGQLKNFSDLQK